MAIDENRCEAFEALGERFGCPEFLVDDNLNAGQDRTAPTDDTGPRRAEQAPARRGPLP